MKRILFSSKNKCKFGCLYCFAQLGDYDKYFYDKENLYKEFDVFYPACDSEIESIDFDELIRYIAKRKRPMVVAISTKSKINNHFLKCFLKVDKELKKHGGFLKIGITITNKSQIDVLEPKTCSFKDRINNLKLLKKNHIFSFVVMRPILPFLDKKEFKEIIDDTKDFTSYYLLGGLYIFKSSMFYKRYIKDDSNLTIRQVDWLKNKPKWFLLEDKKINRYIKAYLKKNDLIYFDNDLKLIKHCWDINRKIKK